MKRLSIVWTVTGSDGHAETIHCDDKANDSGRYCLAAEVESALEAAYKEGWHDARKALSIGLGIMSVDAHWRTSVARADLK